jgi:hypothetical protein
MSGSFVSWTRPSRYIRRRSQWFELCPFNRNGVCLGRGRGGVYGHCNYDLVTKLLRQ